MLALMMPRSKGDQAPHDHQVAARLSYLGDETVHVCTAVEQLRDLQIMAMVNHLLCSWSGDLGKRCKQSITCHRAGTIRVNVRVGLFQTVWSVPELTRAFCSEGKPGDGGAGASAPDLDFLACKERSTRFELAIPPLLIVFMSMNYSMPIASREVRLASLVVLACARSAGRGIGASLVHAAELSRALQPSRHVNLSYRQA
jgi:hypothetical protein